MSDRNYVLIDDVVTEYILFDGAESRPWIILIPGNPGNIRLYNDFLCLLHEKTGNTVLGLSHAGHCGLTDVEYSLEDQISHKIKALNWIQSDNSTLAKRAESGFVVLGHSIGAYISIKLKQREPELPIHHVVSLCPTIRHLREGLAPLVRMVVESGPWLHSIVACLFHYSPNGVKHWLLHLTNDLTEESRFVTVDLLSYSLVKNVLGMANEECRVVRHVDNEVHGALTGRKASAEHTFIYSRIDPYTPEPFIEQFESDYGHIRCLRADWEVKHAFVLQGWQKLAHQLVSDAQLARAFAGKS